jgi:hypothetical protein
MKKLLGMIMAIALSGCGTSDTTSQAAGSSSDSSSGGTTSGASTGASSSTGLPPGSKRIFITHDKFLGNLANGGGLSGADKTCDTAAQAASLGGAWKAWASTTTANAIDRIADVGPWLDLKGTKIFENKEGLKTSPLAGLWLDEQGVGLASESIWTGTNFGGIFSNTPTQEACMDWTSSSMGDGAKIGQVGRQDGAAWTAYSSTSCDQQAHLLCLEQ